MKNSVKVLIIVVIAVLMLAVGLFSSCTLTKAQQTSGVVTIAFDDGNQDQYDYAYPLLQQYGMAGTFYIISGDVGTGGYVTVPELQTMQTSGDEIGSHSVDHPSFYTLTEAQINYECNVSQQFLQSNGLSAVNFAYPYGGSNSTIDSIVLQYYRSARYAYGGNWQNPISPSTDIPMGFAGEAQDVSTALTQDEQAVNEAIATNSWVIIFFHNVIPDATGYLPYGIDTSSFSALLGYIANSGVRVLTINQALNLGSTYKGSISNDVVVSPSFANLDLGQNQTFTADAWGGTSPYTYAWYLNGIEVSNKSAIYTFEDLSAGSFSLYVNVTDSSNSSVTVRSRTLPITVNAPLASPTAFTSASEVDQGQTFSLSSSNVVTGSSPYTYQWYEKDPTGSYSSIYGATSSSYSFVTDSSTIVGGWSFQIQLTDAASEQVVSNFVAVMVDSAPAVSVSPGSWTMDIGQSAMFSASASGGSGNYPTYQWYVDSSLQSGHTSSSFTYSPASSGSHLISAVVVDSLGGASSQFTASVHVSASPVVSVSPVGPLSLDVGQNQIFTGSAAGGSGSLTYHWYLDGSAVGGNSSSYSYFAAGSVHSIACEITDSASVPVVSPSSNIVSVTVNAALVTPSISASSYEVDRLQASDLNSSAVTTGTAPYTYQWLSMAPSATSYSQVKGATHSNYSFGTTGSTATGHWHFMLQLTDAVGSIVNSSATLVAVNSVLAVPTVSTSASAIDQGQTSGLAVSAVTTGTAPYTYQWLGKAPGVSSYSLLASVTSPAYNFTSTNSTSVGNWNFILEVIDNTGTAANSSAAPVTVNPVLAVSKVSASAVTLDQGQTSGLAVSAVTTGTAPCTYQWLSMAPSATSYSQVKGATLANYSFVTSGSTSVGQWRFMLQLTDAVGSVANSSATSVTVDSALAVPEVSASTSTLDQGQISNMSGVAITTGTGPYSYQWLSKAPSATTYSLVSGATSQSYNFTTSSSTAAGTWNFILQVTDNAGTTANSTSVTLAVNPALAAPTVGFSQVTVVQGQNSVLTSTALSTGLSPYMYQWFGEAPGTSAYTSIYEATSDTSSSSYDFETSASTVAGTWNFILQVTDNLGTTVNSTAVSVTVDTPAPSPTVTPASSSSPVPTTAPTASPTLATSATPSPAPSPTAPEFSSAALTLVAVVLAAATLSAVAISRKKQRSCDHK